MKSLIKYTLAAVALMGSVAAQAQNTASGYFLDNYNYRYQLNPAAGNSRNFISMPLLGNVNEALRGNIHLTSLVFNRDGRTVLFTNPLVSWEEMDIKDRNNITENLKLNLLSAGFSAFGGYNTVSLNAALNVNATIPGTFFELAKQGLSNRTYDISDLRFGALGYGELALGHSRDVKALPGLRVGATVKLLVGIANLDAHFNRADITLGRDSWEVTTNADVYANVGGFRFTEDENKRGEKYVSGADLNGEGSVGPNGFGAAFDLGAEYKVLDFVTVSASITDLGFINFNNTQYATTGGDRSFSTDAYSFTVAESEKFDDEVDQFRDDFGRLYELQNRGNIGSRTASLDANLNVGADVALPMYRQLHFGLLYTHRFGDVYGWNEYRLSANWHPIKCLSANINGVVGSFGAGFGWMLNFYAPGFNIFMGMDRSVAAVTKQFVPLNTNMSFNLGMNFPF